MADLATNRIAQRRVDDPSYKRFRNPGRKPWTWGSTDLC